MEPIPTIVDTLHFMAWLMLATAATSLAGIVTVTAANAFQRLHRRHPTMRSLLIAPLLLVPIAAHAWDTPPAPPQTPAPWAKSHSTSTSKANATARATGGTASASQSQKVVVVAGGNRGGSTSPQGAANVGLPVTTSGTGSQVNFAAPSWSLPSITAGGYDCPTVGVSGGGSGPMGGGGIGPSWISSRCDHRKYAETIATLTGDPQQGLAYLASVESDVADYLKSRQQQPVSTPVTTVSAPVSTAPVGASGYCYEHMTAAERARHPECGR